MVREEEMGCGSSSPTEVAEYNSEPGRALDLKAQSSSSSFDLGKLPKKNFTVGVPKRVGRRRERFCGFRPRGFS